MAKACQFFSDVFFLSGLQTVNHERGESLCRREEEYEEQRGLPYESPYVRQ